MMISVLVRDAQGGATDRRGRGNVAMEVAMGVMQAYAEVSGGAWSWSSEDHVLRHFWKEQGPADTPTSSFWSQFCEGASATLSHQPAGVVGQPLAWAGVVGQPLAWGGGLWGSYWPGGRH